ncbi:toxin-antitoxin system YwqK family antitoxin [Nocardia sp. NPDC004722]
MRISGDQAYDDDGYLSYDGAPYTGEVEVFAENGQRVELSSYYEGVENGPQQEWWPNGNKRAEGYTDMGAAVGEWRYWHENGQMSEEVVLNANGDQLTRKRWDAAGRLTKDVKIR